jgi:putative phage-type endonuclease
MGLSRWKTPLQLWAEKVGRVNPADLSDNEAVQLGIELEDFVSKMFEKKTGMKVMRTAKGKQYVHPEYPYMRARPDRLVVKTEDLLECKTTNARMGKEWKGDEIPQEYIIQVQWQLMITGRTTGWIAVLIGGQQFCYKKIKADQELFALMIDAAMNFKKMVEDNTQPLVCGDDADTILALYPTSNEIISVDETFNRTIRHLQELKMHISAMKEEQEEIEVKIKDAIKGFLGIKTQEYVVKWPTQESTHLDTDAVKAAGLYEQFAKKSSTRVLRVTKVLKEEV